MHGLMMNDPLQITAIMEHAELNHPDREIVSVTADVPLHRYTYADAFRRARRLANALDALGLNPSARVATLAWNDYRHFELYYAVSCSGRVLHTVNPRLFEDQLAYIINHAEDRYVFTDPLFVPMLEKLQDRLETVQGFFVLTDEAHMPDTSLRGARAYESLIHGQPDTYDWPEVDERTATALCYTSGTTGNPKGVLYSHRCTVLHSYGIALPDVMDLSSREVILPIVPMFHVNAWGTPYAAPMVGAKMVMPGPKLGDGETLFKLMEGEGVTMSAGVPTVWLALKAYLEQSGAKLSSLNRIVVGGSACPTALMDYFREEHDVHMHHAWGMTEMTPLGTFNAAKAGMEALPEAERRAIEGKQGRAVFGVRMKITGDDNTELPWDGKAFGTLKVRGPWVCSGYYRLEESDAHDEDGWFSTGDVATIDADGFMCITDRTKDVIKSGGEWISSIELENLAVAHPAVAEAAVIGVSHDKWAERPLLVVVKKDGEEVEKDELLTFFEGKIAKWWVPDDVVFVDELPHTATGKISKLQLRKRFADYRLPT